MCMPGGGYGTLRIPENMKQLGDHLRVIGHSHWRQTDEGHLTTEENRLGWGMLSSPESCVCIVQS